MRAITKVDIVSLLDLSWGNDGLVKGDKIIRTLTDLVGDHGRYITFHPAEVAIPRGLFANILHRIDGL